MGAATHASVRHAATLLGFERPAAEARSTLALLPPRSGRGACPRASAASATSAEPIATSVRQDPAPLPGHPAWESPLLRVPGKTRYVVGVPRRLVAVTQRALDCTA